MAIAGLVSPKMFLKSEIMLSGPPLVGILAGGSRPPRHPASAFGPERGTGVYAAGTGTSGPSNDSLLRSRQS